MSDKNEKKESITLSAESLQTLINEASKGAVKAALEALQAPKPVEAKKTESQLMEDAMKGLSDEEKEEFKRSFGAGTCPECQQPSVRGRYACKGKHTKLVAFPDDEHWGRFFQGVFINGARYLSNGPGHEITVPADNNIKHEIQKWVEMERQNAQGRKKSWNSGSIGGSGNTDGYRPYNGPGWR